jgi:hypothetical protein
MPPTNPTEICYLLAFPDQTETTSEPLEEIRGLKDAPYFQPVDIRVRTLGHVEVQAGGVQVSVLRQKYDDRIQMVECRFQMNDVLSTAAIQQREIVERNLTERFVPVEYRTNGMFEEYTILLLTQAKPTTDKYVDRNASSLARFIRSQREVFDEPEITEILSSRVRYSKHDLTLVDWEGAVIIAPNGDFQSDIELLKVGNYQLLRFRMLDNSLEKMLDTINESFLLKSRRVRPTRGAIRRIVEHRMEVMVDFERTEQTLLLIGDWYTAKLYTAIRSEFYLEEWKNTIRGKLDNLESIVQTIKDNFTLSWESLWGRLEMAGWAILLIGYIYLFLADLGLLSK